MVHPFLSRFSSLLGILGIPDPDSRILLEDYLREPHRYNPTAHHVGRSSHLGLVSHECARYSEVSGIAGGCKSIRVPNVARPLASWTNVLHSHGCCYLDRRSWLGHLETSPCPALLSDQCKAFADLAAVAQKLCCQPSSCSTA